MFKNTENISTFLILQNGVVKTFYDFTKTESYKIEINYYFPYIFEVNVLQER